MVARGASVVGRQLYEPSSSVLASDSWVVTRIRTGDQRVFDALFLEFYRPLCAFLRAYVVVPEDAEEIVQDIFLNLWKDRSTWVVQGSVRSYLFGAARNRGLNHARNRRRAWQWSNAVDYEAMLTPTSVGADATAGNKELAEAIARAVGRLPERQRQTYALRWGHHLTIPEIAHVMGVTTKCVEAQLTKASKVLRQALAKYL